MINILIPLAGKNTFKLNDSSAFPNILNDICGELLIERAAKPFTDLVQNKKIIIALPKEESEKYRLNKVLPLLSEDITLCNINGNTKGAVCSALLAIEHLDLDSPLIISSFEQVLDFDLYPLITDFINSKVDAGVLTFEAIHPKWSYVKVDDEKNVTQAAEKLPISRNAVAGFYFFKTARIFFESAQAMIRKDVKTNDLFYISPTLNEIILNEGTVKALPIDKAHYYHINDEHSLGKFEEKVLSEKHNPNYVLRKRTEDYAKAFNSRDIDQVKPFFASQFKLNDPSISLEGSINACEYIDKIFSGVNTFSFEVKNIFVTDNRCSIIEFELEIDGNVLVGTDIIKWNEKLNMLSMNAYLYEKNNG
ncbi:hypothetical protein GNP44_05020 [Aliivibrio fischeri]|uniref:hypothetical protein n=1 Tax=Aliivibrio fischeri TaxID=668 RepID=UPI0012D94B0A|nr:hypothetical protein [Aliivibrio fischeri]MUK29464.1 hypothetical protein [Aliivibrio fischeri]